jgi:hypothetical protein
MVGGVSRTESFEQDVYRAHALYGCWRMQRHFGFAWVDAREENWHRRVTPDTLWLTASGILINRRLSRFRPDHTEEDLLADEPQLRKLPFGWGFIHADNAMDGMAHRYISLHIAPRLGRHFKHCERFTYHLFARPPELPPWIDGEYIPSSRAIIVYGERVDAGS